MHLAVPQWWQRAGAAGGASKGYKLTAMWAPWLLPFGSEAVLEAGQRARGATAVAQGSCTSSARRVFVGGGLASMLPEASLTGTGRLGSSWGGSSVWLNMRECTLPSCPCILALVPSCLRSNVCSGVSCYSCWAEQKMVCQAENIWGFNKMPPFRKGDEECVFTGELPFSPGGCETDADELVKVVHSSRNLFWIFSSPFFASQAVFQLLANTSDV